MKYENKIVTWVSGVLEDHHDNGCYRLAGCVFRSILGLPCWTHFVRISIDTLSSRNVFFFYFWLLVKYVPQYLQSTRVILQIITTPKVSQWLRSLHLHLISSRCIYFSSTTVFKYFNDETLTDGEWQNVVTKIVHDILMKFHWKHRNGAGREVGHVVDQIVIQKRQQTRETL